MDHKHASGGPFNSKPPMSDKYIRDKQSQLPASMAGRDSNVYDMAIMDSRKKTIQYGQSNVKGADTNSLDMSGISNVNRLESLSINALSEKVES